MIITDPKPKTVWYIVAAVAVLFIIGGGVYWHICHNRCLQEEIVVAQPNERTIARFNELKRSAEWIRADEGDFYHLLTEMKEIANRYPNNNNFQQAIQEFKNQ